MRGNDIARGAGRLQGFRPPSRASAPRSSAWRAALPVGARPPGRLVFPACAPCGYPPPPATTRRTILLQRFSFDSGPAHEQPVSADHQRHLGDKFCHPTPGHGPSSPGCTTQGSVHNRHPIIPKGSLAHGARGAPYPRTRVTGCFAEGCAARTIGDHPGGVRRGEKFFAPTTAGVRSGRRCTRCPRKPRRCSFPRSSVGTPPRPLQRPA